MLVQLETIEKEDQMNALLRAILWTIALVCLGSPITALAQAYPVKPIRLIAPWEPGAATDINARILAPKMSDDLGQPVVVENRGGAAGQIGAALIARAAPDGYTIMLTPGGIHILSLFLSKNLPYHPVKDFTPITAIAVSVMVLAAHPSFAPNSLKEVVDYAKRNPGKVSYGSSGIGADTHLAMEQFLLVTGTEMVHIPFKGGGPAATSLVGGQIPFAILALPSVLPQVRSGKVKLLAVLLPKRYPALPDIPTVVEIFPRYENPANWMGVFGPAGMPSAIARRLHASIAKALAVPEIRDGIESRGQVILGLTPEETAAQIATAVESSGKLVKLLGLQPE